MLEENTSRDEKEKNGGIGFRIMTWFAGGKYLQRRKRGKWRHLIWDYDMDCWRKIPPETKKRKMEAFDLGL